MNKQLTLNGELLLLCERKEMARLLNVYLQYLFRQGMDLPALQLVNYRSLEQLKPLAERLPNFAGSQQVRKILILADAQNDIEKRRNMILDVRSSAYFRSREYCAHFFFPGRSSGKRWRKGYMEDLLLETLCEDAAEQSHLANLLNASEDFLLTVNNNREPQQRLSNHSLHLLYAFFAGTEKFVGLSLAEAAQLGAFDFQHPGFQELHKRFQELSDNHKNTKKRKKGSCFDE
ncbi:MAG: hypothetical protein ACI3XC_00710 [Phascolarctobacterium sp.]